MLIDIIALTFIHGDLLGDFAPRHTRNRDYCRALDASYQMDDIYNEIEREELKRRRCILDQAIFLKREAISRTDLDF